MKTCTRNTASTAVFTQIRSNYMHTDLCPGGLGLSLTSSHAIFTITTCVSRAKCAGGTRVFKTGSYLSTEHVIAEQRRERGEIRVP